VWCSRIFEPVADVIKAEKLRLALEKREMEEKKIGACAVLLRLNAQRDLRLLCYVPATLMGRTLQGGAWDNFVTECKTTETMTPKSLDKRFKDSGTVTASLAVCPPELVLVLAGILLTAEQAKELIEIVLARDDVKSK
jgi:hypothetical protein